MTDINYLGAISLGKINKYESNKESTLMPISFPGQNSGKTEAIDTLGIISYVNISGRITGDFATLQTTIYLLNFLLDGNQIAASKLISPYVNQPDSNDARRVGMMGINQGSGSDLTSGIATSELYQTYKHDTSDKVKNLITGAVANVVAVMSEHYITLDANIFSTTGLPYALTANINVKVLKFNYRWELPGMSYVDYDLSVVQVK